MDIVEKGKKEIQDNLVEENKIITVAMHKISQLAVDELLIEENNVAYDHSCLGIHEGYSTYKNNKKSGEDIPNSVKSNEIYNPQNEQQDIFLEKDETPSEICEDAEYFLLLNDLPHPMSERWPPLGANYDDASSPQNRELTCNDPNNIFRLQHLEEEQELLTSSLLALTSHFAHVQLRVRQIVEASPEERENLLKELDDFAFQGIPESISSNVTPSAASISSKSNIEIDDVKSRQRQHDVIEYLKLQLSELEKLAYEYGAPDLPQNDILKKQKVIIDELKNKLNLKVEEHELPQLSSEELKYQVDNAIGGFVGPLKMKEQLVGQLKTQITDLERFIFFLQCDSDDTKMNLFNGSNNKLTGAYNSYAAKKKQHTNNRLPSSDKYAMNSLKPSCSHNGSMESQGVQKSLNSKAQGLMDKASVLIQMFATTHFGPKTDSFKKNTLKKTAKGNHWGDLRAQLEVDIQEVTSLASTLLCDREKLKNLKLATKPAQNSQAKASQRNILETVQPFSKRNNQSSRNSLRTYALSSDSDDDTYECFDWNRNMKIIQYKRDSVGAISRELNTVVRKKFALTLERLIQHGLREEITSVTSSIMIPFLRCFNLDPVFTAEHDRVRDFGSQSSFPDYGASGVSEKRIGHSDHFDSEYFGGKNSRFRPMHAWELILGYYYLKNGDEYNNTPARKLSYSFNLDIVESKVITAKQNLLTTIGNIIAMHQPYKRSFTAHFKAFVCAGLNAKQLVDWLELIFSCSNLIEIYYTSNSYAMRTGFRDSLRSIEILTKYDFNLPVDLAVRHFKNI